MRRLFTCSALAVAMLLAAAPALAAAPSEQILTAQILLDRAHQSPGVIDGRAGSNTRRAVAAFEEATGLPVDGELNPAVMEGLQAYADAPLVTDHQIMSDEVADLVQVPASMAEQSTLDHLGYATPVEALAERFHMSQELLKELNPEATFAVGDTIRVVQPGADKLAAKVSRIEIDKAKDELRAFDAGGELIASYPATIGSGTFPSPSGDMAVRAVAPHPVYYFNPEGHAWGPDQRLTIPAGPNNPVGATWIDLTKDGYGIHGTPEPRLIGKTASHGCVRLTNWDAVELATAVSAGTAVSFVEAPGEV